MIGKRLQGLREELRVRGLDGYLITGTDPHQSEYVPLRWRTRKFISGFSGSAGTVVVTMDKDGKVVVTVVNSSFQNHKTVDFTQYGPCCQAVLYSSDTVLPPSVFMEAEVLDQICAGTLDMPPHSVLFLCF